MLDELLQFARAGRNAPLIERRRAEAIVARVRLFAGLFAAFTAAWIGFDALTFPPAEALAVAAARLVATGLFVALVFACRPESSTLGEARVRLAALFAVPAAFFFAALALIGSLPGASVPRGVAAAYAFVPFVMAAGIGAFPLLASESVAIAAWVLAVEALALASPWRASTGFPDVSALWLLSLIAVAAGFAALSQLKLLAALVQLAMRDPLTGCLRRESGSELLEWQFLVAARQGAPLAILFADIDHFKDVNDTSGHEAGDRVLATAAASLRAAARESDVLVRWGGEEFVLALPHTTHDEALALIGRLRARGFGSLPDGRPVTLSIGVAEHPADGSADAAELVAQADRRMYLAKQAGRNRYAAGDAAPVEILADAASTKRKN